jgi:hypothetical protein
MDLNIVKRKNTRDFDFAGCATAHTHRRAQADMISSAQE